MDIIELENLIFKRLQLTKKYPEYKGRHIFFKANLKNVLKGLELSKRENISLNEKQELYKLGKDFINIRNSELQSHNSRFNTQKGNEIHECEYYLYSMALDVFQTYGTKKL